MGGLIVPSTVLQLLSGSNPRHLLQLLVAIPMILIATDGSRGCSMQQQAAASISADDGRMLTTAGFASNRPRHERDSLTNASADLDISPSGTYRILPDISRNSLFHWNNTQKGTTLVYQTHRNQEILRCQVNAVAASTPVPGSRRSGDQSSPVQTYRTFRRKVTEPEERAKVT